MHGSLFYTAKKGGYFGQSIVSYVMAILENRKRNYKMLEKFYPGEYLDSAYEIDFEDRINRGIGELFLILIILWCGTANRRMRERVNCLSG